MKNRFLSALLTLVLCAPILALRAKAAPASSFVKVKGHQFTLQNRPYYYIGANYWYGGTLALDKDPKRGADRVTRELNFLRAQGVTNLRVLAGAEGSGQINGVNRVGPSLQPTRGQFDPQVLDGLDFLLHEMGKRGMKAVLYLSNNWEWSGGFQQYAQWNGLGAAGAESRKLNWDEQRDIVSRFYGSAPSRADYLKQVGVLLARRNRYSGLKYVDDSAIMSWQLANEPRPMRPAANADYLSWIRETAAFIKARDKNHLISVGSEGEMGTENAQLFEDTHSDANIDYLTIHIWPKNWNWIPRNATGGPFPDLTARTSAYIDKHIPAAQKLNKPLVIEEFGLPRDGTSFDPQSSVAARDGFYRHIFTLLQNSARSGGVLAGVNFWSFGGQARPIAGQIFWKAGDEVTGDPPMEEQGLNSVFDGDASTWALVRSFLR